MNVAQIKIIGVISPFSIKLCCYLLLKQLNWVLLLASVMGLVMQTPAAAQDRISRSQLSVELIQGRIAAVQDSKRLDDSVRIRTIELYRQAIANLETIRANQRAVDEYRRIALEAPAKIESLRKIIERRQRVDPTKNLRIGPQVTYDELDRMLESELANHAAVSAKQKALDARLEAEAQRPSQARERIAAIRILMEDVSLVALPHLRSDGLPLLAEAKRWNSETRIEALQSEISMLDQELISHSARLSLLRVQREETALATKRIDPRIELLRSALTERRRSEADFAKVQAQAVMEGVAAHEPFVKKFAQGNLNLVELLQQQVDELKSLSLKERQVRPLNNRLTEAYRSARRKLELEGSNAPLGLAIGEQRRQLPDTKEYYLQRRQVQESITAVSLLIIENEDERRSMIDLSAYLDGLANSTTSTAVDTAVKSELETLAKTRRSLLDRAIANGNIQLRRLHALDDILRQLENKTTAYDKFLAKRLLWVKSTLAIDIQAFAELRGEITVFTTLTTWLEVGLIMLRSLWQAPWYLLAITVAILLLWRREPFRSALVTNGKNVGRIRSDSIKYTANALGLTLFLALPESLILLTLGSALATANQITELSLSLAHALVSTAILLFLIMWFHMLLEPGGLAERHFAWNQTMMNELGRQLTRFGGLGLPVYFISLFVLTMAPATSGGTLGFIFFTAFMIILVGLIVGLLHPTRGVIRGFLAARVASGWWRWRYVWFTLAVAVPLILIILRVAGYSHSAVEISRRVIMSIWFVTTVWISGELIRRWLLMTSRRLAYDAAVKAREEARARRSSDSSESVGELADDIGAPEVDLEALDADSRKLVNATLVLLVVLGLFAIWEQMFPALGILDGITLWSTAFRADNLDIKVSVTLADALLAIVIAIAGYILAKNLPSLLDIILLKQGKVSEGSRYAVSTLARYLIVIAATLLVLGRLGASWSQLGWAAAALGVGIGFGLQEIVANFISGLILLAERPVRVGDIITIGDASGVVKRIRIRATTIRDWEQKELLIPNKELITGRLLNWTLSDAVTRVLISVGIAYGSDVDKAIEVLLEIASEDERVLDDPPPGVVFDQFGDSSLNLGLRVFVGTLTERLPVMTDMHRNIHRRFMKEGIVIAFPQRDVRIYSTESS